MGSIRSPVCAMVKTWCLAYGHPSYNGNPWNGYIKAYWWIDDHPLYWKINNVLIVLIMAHAGGRHLNHLVLQRKSKKIRANWSC